MIKSAEYSRPSTYMGSQTIGETSLEIFIWYFRINWM